MCLRPVQRPNPFYNPDSVGDGSPSLQRRIHLVGLSFCRPDTKYIMVPCNTCPACIAMRQNDIVQRAQVEARFSHVFFLTFTYNNEHLPSISVPVPSSAAPFLEPASVDDVEPYDFESAPLDPLYDGIGDLPETDEEVAARVAAAAASFLARQKEKKAQRDTFTLPDSVESVTMSYANHHHLQDVIRHFRNDVLSMPEFSGRKMKYLGVSELGGQKGRPHFHLLLFIEKLPSDLVVSSSSLRYSGSRNFRPSVITGMTDCLYNWFRDNWAVNVGTKKFPKYEPLYTYIRKPDPSSPTGWKCTFDCHYVSPEATEAGTDDVAFYVSKYIMKASDREVKRKVFLQAALDETTFAKFWRIVRSRMLISKGFGTHSETVVNSDGRHEILPDADVLREINSNCRLDAGKSPGPVFVTDMGKHRPLSRYYFNKHSGDVYAWTVDDLRYIFDSFDRSNYSPAYDDPELVKRKDAEFEVRKNLMLSHETL